MVKELILAIALGAILGFGVTGSYYFMKHNKNSVNSADQATPTPAAQVDNQATPTPEGNLSVQNVDELPLFIDTPINESVVDQAKIDFQGSTVPNSLIVITTPINSYTTTADTSGNFDTEIDLEAGVNIIDVTIVDPQDNQTNTQILVTYSTADF